MVLKGIFFQDECCYVLKIIYLLTVLSPCCCVDFSLVAASRGYSLLQWMGFSLQWLLLYTEHRLQGVQASVVAIYGFSSCGSWALEHRLNSYGEWVQLLHSMWDILRPGIEPISSALASRFFTTEPPGKPCYFFKRSGKNHQNIIE